MQPNALVGTTVWTYACQGVARILSEDIPEFDNGVGVEPWRGPDERPPTNIGAVFDRYGGVTVVDDGDLIESVNGMSTPPGVLVAFESLNGVLADNSTHTHRQEFAIRIVLRSPTVAEHEDHMPRRADLLGAIIARLHADRYGLGGAGRIPWPADIDPSPETGPPVLTRCLSHGILAATTVGPPSRLPGEGPILRDDIRVTYAANMVNDGGRWRMQE